MARYNIAQGKPLAYIYLYTSTRAITRQSTLIMTTLNTYIVNREIVRNLDDKQLFQARSISREYKAIADGEIRKRGLDDPSAKALVVAEHGNAHLKYSYTRNNLPGGVFVSIDRKRNMALRLTKQNSIFWHASCLCTTYQSTHRHSPGASILRHLRKPPASHRLYAGGVYGPRTQVSPAEDGHGPRSDG